MLENVVEGIWIISARGSKRVTRGRLEERTMSLDEE